MRLPLVDRRAAHRFVVIAVLAVAWVAHLRRRSWRSAPAHGCGSQPLTPGRRTAKLRLRYAGFGLAFLSLLGIAAAVYEAFQLTRQPTAPTTAGTARLLEPGNPYNPANRFQLMLILNAPGEEYAEYHIVAGCGTTARHVLLMLSGDARLLHPRYVMSSNLSAVQRTATVSQPWFPSPHQVQVFDIPVETMRCPPGATPAESETLAAIGGTIRHSFEASAGSAHALQLPLVGDEENVDTHIPALGGGMWASPVLLTVSVEAGPLPLRDQIEVARPAMTGSGALSWSGRSYLIPSATWTDLSANSRNQFAILILGAAIGILGAVPITLALNWARSD